MPLPPPSGLSATSSDDTLKRQAAAAWAREDLYDFSRWMFLQRRGYKWVRGPHHQIICDALMRVYRGETKRLIINVPPRYSKTEIAAINFMAWALGRHPDAEFIHTSYSGRLAAKNSGDCRSLVRDPAYAEIFPNVVLRYDSKARDEWRTTDGGCVYAVGSGGTITGYGAGKHRPGFGGAIIIDDPHKADEARSDLIREGVIEWFQNTLESRKNGPDTPIILIMQRLHERDLAGWLLGGGNGEKWDQVILKALQDDGTALWPEKHSVAELMRMEAAAPLTFAGQYQQSPCAADGNVFKPDEIKADVAAHEVVRWVRGWDLAGSRPIMGRDPDWTVGAKLGLTASNRYVIGDIRRLRGSPDEVERAIMNTAEADGPEVRISLPQDPGQAGKFQAGYLVRKLSGFSAEATPESGDKVTRAEPFAAQVNVGNVVMAKSDWNEGLKSEMRVFPTGAHDDQVDALSRAFTALNTILASQGLLDLIRREAVAKEAPEPPAVTYAPGSVEWMAANGMA